MNTFGFDNEKSSTEMFAGMSSSLSNDSRFIMSDRICGTNGLSGLGDDPLRTETRVLLSTWVGLLWRRCGGGFAGRFFLGSSNGELPP